MAYTDWKKVVCSLTSILFTKEERLSSSVTGKKAGKGGGGDDASKNVLDAQKVNYIIGEPYRMLQSKLIHAQGRL